MPYEKIGKEVRCIADEIPFEIPNSWEWVRLETAVLTEMGQSPSGDSVSSASLGIEFHQGKVFFGEKFLQKSNQITSQPSKIVEAGTILLCVRAPVGKVNVTQRKICIGRGLCGIAPIIDIESDFLYYLLESYENIFIKKATGTTFVAITAEVVKKQLIPLPPLAEQKRIVAKIEELLPHIKEYGKAESKVSKLNVEFPEQLKKSILQWAIQGKLVPQNPEDEPASVLLERIRTEKAKLVKEGKIKKDKNESVIFRRDNSHYEKLNGIERCIDDEIPFEIPDSWVWVRLEKMITLLSGQDFPPTGYNSKNEGIPYITGASNIENENILINRWTETPRNIAQHDDLLIVCKGAGVGKMAILQNSRVHIARQIMAIRCYNLVLNKYLMLYLTTKINEIRSHMNGLIPGIDRQVMLSILTPLPPLAEQKRIVAEIEKIFKIQTTMRSK